MWKPLLVLAVLANTFLISSTEGSSKSVASASSKSSSEQHSSKSCSHSSSSSHVHSSSKHGSHCHGNDHGKPLKCGKNEVFSECPAFVCKPLECDEVGFPLQCLEKGGKCPVKPACICIDGFVKNSTGKCIPIKRCPSCGGDPNAVSGCGVNCGRHCSDLHSKEPVACIDICFENACDCKEGFVFDDNIGKCVRPKHCTPPCGKHEVLSNCSNGGCGPWTCSDLGFPTGCVKMDPKNCKIGCVCKEGYVRNENGKCIPKTDCPECGGDPNAIAGCGINCGRLCSNYNKGPVACAAVCLENACDCRKHFVFDENTKKCVLPKDCTPVCGKHEVFSECINGGCEAKNCSQLGHPVPCVKPIKCIPGCLCEKGYLRDDNGKCVPKNKCPLKCTKPHEFYDPCPPICPPQTCESIGQIYHCPMEPTIKSEKNCKGACRCVKGFFRNKKGECISEEDCLKCRGPHEFFSCGGACDNVCATLKEQNQTHCPIINIVCNPMCYCDEGFARDHNDICIPIDECPECGVNERFEKCPDWLCAPQWCTELGFPLACPDIPENATCPGPPRCVCKNNFVRDHHGKCIPQKKCPSCGGDPNAESGCGLNCGRLCSNYDKGPVPCPRICYPNACDCKKDYVFDENTKKCVLPKHCTPICKKNEVYSDCINGGCQAKNCSQLGKPIPCIKIDPRYCIKGCLCKEGYLRSKNGICIPEEKCDTCGENERYEKCPPRLCTPQKCSQLGFPIPCPSIPDDSRCPEPPSCVCIDNYVRDSNGKCIPKEKCSSCGGDLNAVSGCGVNCGRHCSNFMKKGVACPAICNINGCDCRNGFVFDDNIKKCVRPEHCTPVCGKYEVYNSCANGGCDKRNCSQLGQPDICIDVIECIGGCVCQNGYLRAKNGTCIPQNQCPIPQCGKHETFVQCPHALCTPQTCSQLGFPIPCPAIAEGSACPGPPRCVCEAGYVRDDDGDCIPKKHCPSCGGDPNAVSGCGINCGRLCSNYDKGPVPCPKICKVNACDCRKGFVFDTNTKKCVRPIKCTPVCKENEVFSECINGGCQPKNCSQLKKPVPCVKIDPKHCKKGCLCKEGYLRANNGTCVPKDQCYRKCNQPHEYYDPCPPTCPPQTCESLNETYSCPAMIIGDTLHCVGDCRCEKGYYRNKIGQCISKADCLKCTGPHEFFACGGACDNVCATLHEQNQTHCPIINIKCNPMCYCEKGFARNNKDICIPIHKCPAPKCKENERLERCPQWLCTPQTCSQLGFPIPCPALSGNSSSICPGPPACVCDNDYVRNSHGICVPKDQCPSCGGDPNARAGCGVHCGNRCSNYKKKPAICPLICFINSCDCKDGFVYDDNTKKCVRPKDCTPVCGNNEVYDTCANGGCQKRNCSQLGEPTLCIDPIKCIGGCVCREGYLRAKNGTCVPEKQCPKKCHQPHEIYDPCPPICPPQTCESIGKSYSCPAMITGAHCEGACRCEKGYYRNKIGQCISKSDCLKCTGPHEYFSCGGACDNVCAFLHEWDQTHCPIINIKCNPMCYCEKGYARDSNHICIPIDKCPAPKCGPHERYERCPPWLCTPQKCSQVGFPIPCPALTGNSSATCPGRPACVCDDGYVRNKHGKCIPIAHCPSCGGDPNAVSGCGINCGRLCSNYKKKNVVCPLICKVNGCDCRKGFVYDTNIKKCVRPRDCTPVCGKNEVYDSCANGGCRKWNCSQLTEPLLCIDPIKCIGGCICQTGYLRTKNGTCVPENECPSPCTKPHEYYDPCPSNCPPQTCDSIGKVFPCPAPLPPGSKYCRGECRCEKGYYRNKIGECISEKDCLKCTGPNEFFSCGSACDNVCATLHEQNQTHCPIKNKKCVSKCYCEKGFARDHNGVCIPIKQCGVTCHGDPNAVPGCGINCGRHCSEINKGPVFCPAICLKDACDCKQNYVFDDNIGKCVLPKDCTPVCGKNEVFNACINGGCQKKNCSQLGQPVICVHPKECIKGCLCRDGYLRAENGTCVPRDKCPNKCQNPNEVWDPCPSTCPPQTCESLDRAYVCPIEGDEPPCEGDCVCKKGHYRNKIGECISEKDCLKCMGPHEYFSCGGACDNVCETLNEQNQTHCPIINIKCNPRCYCEKGYARNYKNICIPIPECPKPRCGPNERYEESPSKVCDPLYCSELGFTLDCPPVEDPDCEDTPGCICKKGYVRNYDDVCIPKSECPSCGGDPNAVAGCGVNCGRHCSDYGKEVSCIEQCFDNACDCRDGFYYDDVTGKCVLLEHCRNHAKLMVRIFVDAPPSCSRSFGALIALILALTLIHASCS